MAAPQLAGGAPLTPAPPAALPAAAASETPSRHHRATVDLAVAARPKPKQYKQGVRAVERECQATIVEAAHALGYRALAIRPAVGRQQKWQSPIQGDAGYPDLTLAHPDAGVLFVELKRPPNGLEAPQRAWGEALIAAGAVWRLVWVPEQLDAFVQELADRTRRTGMAS